MMHYNFSASIRRFALRLQMAAGITDRAWDVSDLVALLEASERESEKSGVLN